MSYCVKCGAKVDDGIMVCPQCGARIPDLSGSRPGSYNDGSSIAGGQSAWDAVETRARTGYNDGSSIAGGQSGGSQYTYDRQKCGPDSYERDVYQQSESRGYFDQNEVYQNKAMGVLSYLGILVIIPLLAGDKRSEYVKHHINQGLVLFLLSSLTDLLEGEWVWGLYSIIHFGGNIFSWVFDILGLVFLVLTIMGIVAACRGERKELPLIGKIKFFK